MDMTGCYSAVFRHVRVPYIARAFTVNTCSERTRSAVILHYIKTSVTGRRDPYCSEVNENAARTYGYSITEPVRSDDDCSLSCSGLYLIERAGRIARDRKSQ